MEIGSMLMQLAGGLGLFLFGMKLMGDGLEMAAGSKLRGMIERLTKNKYMGALVGLVVTAVIQSSSATTVMVVGFVNAGLMNLAQAVGVIMGANIGTTVTGVMIAINLTAIAPIAVLIGVVMISFIKRNSVKHIGQIIAGFGILFMGMKMMSTAMEPLSESEVFTSLMTSFSNPHFGRAGRSGVYRDYPKLLRLCRRASGVGRGWRHHSSKRDLCDLRSKYRHLRHRADFQRGHQQDGEKNRGGSLNVQCVWRNPVYRHQYAVPFAELVQRIAPGSVMAQISIVHVTF